MIRSGNSVRASAAGTPFDALGLLAFSYLFATVSIAGADTAPDLSLTPGMRVRILAPDAFPRALLGTIKTVDRESVTIAASGRAEPVSILREKIAHLDVSDGPRSRGSDALIGAGIGTAVGAAVGAVEGSKQKGQIVSGNAVAGVCVLIGAVFGTVIGAVIPPGERWDEIPAARYYRVGFVPRPEQGFDLAIAWRF